MRGCIFFNRSYIRWQHAMVLDLRSRFGVSNWCGYLYGKKALDFINDQEDIKYDQIIVDDFLAIEAKDEVVDKDYLASSEKKYGHPYFWQEFYSDRHMSINWPRQFYPKFSPIFNHYQIKQQLQIRIKKIEKMLMECKPDFVIFTDAGAMGVNLLYHVARGLGIKTLVLGVTRPSDKAGITESLFGVFTGTDRLFKKIRAGEHSSPFRNEAIAWINNFRNKPTKPYYVRPSEVWNTLSQGRWRKFSLFMKNFINKTFGWFDNSFPKVFSYSPIDFLRHNFLLWTSKYRLPKFDAPDYNENYVFFPLQFEPELTLLMYAPYFMDQLWMSMAIAQSLPINFKLYVKEHPTMTGYRDPNFYRQLKKIPNVRLIKTETDSIEIIKNAKLTTIITGTPGWESVLLKKPVITFGSIYYNSLSMVKNCQNISELPLLIKQLLENHVHKEDELIDFASALMEDSFSINFTEMQAERDMAKLLNNRDIRLISDRIIKHIKSPEL
ncbi:MAG: hypothetical protein CEN90_327 [Parcubacteria group bacterium Licking1014_17]|nr:MAG: hypothetical protein CEN90_327 [Parcubacteria group bacterium Licking1014_17]